MGVSTAELQGWGCPYTAGGCGLGGLESGFLHATDGRGLGGLRWSGFLIQPVGVACNGLSSLFGWLVGGGWGAGFLISGHGLGA